MCRRRICAVARTLARVFAVFAVLSGVLLVHGFSGDHDLNGGLAAPGLAQTTEYKAPVAAPSLAAHDHADGRHAHAAGHHAAAHAVPATDASGATGDHGGHGDAHACLALLSASALVLLGMAAGLRGRRLPGVVTQLPALLASRLQALTRAAIPNHLSLLCVSRT